MPTRKRQRKSKSKSKKKTTNAKKKKTKKCKVETSPPVWTVQDGEKLDAMFLATYTRPGSAYRTINELLRNNDMERAKAVVQCLLEEIKWRFSGQRGDELKGYDPLDKALFRVMMKEEKDDELRICELIVRYLMYRLVQLATKYTDVIPSTSVVYRGIQRYGCPEPLLFENCESKRMFHEHGFLSTSLHPDKAQGFGGGRAQVFVLHFEKGIPFIPLKSTEYEVLFLPDTQITVNTKHIAASANSKVWVVDAHIDKYVPRPWMMEMNEKEIQEAERILSPCLRYLEIDPTDMIIPASNIIYKIKTNKYAMWHHSEAWFERRASVCLS